MRATLSPDRYAAWRAREDERANRWRACVHRFVIPEWAGILGWRVHCSKCFRHFNPYEHIDCTTCEEHPGPPYWEGFDEEDDEEAT